MKYNEKAEIVQCCSYILHRFRFPPILALLKVQIFTEILGEIREEHFQIIAQRGNRFGRRKNTHASA
jgi:hypothetical protein